MSNETPNLDPMAEQNVSSDAFEKDRAQGNLGQLHPDRYSDHPENSSVLDELQQFLRRAETALQEVQIKEAHLDQTAYTEEARVNLKAVYARQIDMLTQEIAALKENIAKFDTSE